MILSKAHTGRFIHVYPNAIDIDARVFVVEVIELIVPIPVHKYVVSETFRMGKNGTDVWISGWNQSGWDIMSKTSG